MTERTMGGLITEAAGSILSASRGVQLSAPPPDLITGYLAGLDKKLRELPTGVNGGLFLLSSVKDGKIGVNAAVVTKAPLGFRVEAWVGKTWGDPLEGGVYAARTW